jgi:putative phage-type endonuclease
MLTEEQLAARKIGGSDVATILGLNPWKTALELYAEKRGELIQPSLDDNEAVEAGNVLEDGIAELTQRRLAKRMQNDIKLRRSNRTIVNPTYPWLTVHIDRDVVGRDLGVEIKNVGSRAAAFWGEQGTDDIPEYYLPQPHTYMLVMNYPAWIVSAYFGGGDLRLYDVPRDPEMDAIIIERTHDFWHYNVLKGEPPVVDFSHPGTLNALRRVYSGTSGEIVLASEQQLRWRLTMQELADKASELQGASNVLKAQLLDSMKDASVLRFDDGYDLVRKEVHRDGYTVEPATFVQTRVQKTPQPKPAKKAA